jgi:parallel beta-helix repeat protein
MGCTSSNDATGRPFGGMYVNGGEQNLICGNSLYYASYANINIEASAAGSVIIGNTCSGGGPTNGYGIFFALGCTYMNISGNAVVGNHAKGIGSDTTVGVTLSYGCVNNNEVYYNGMGGIELDDALYSTMNGNIATQNGANADNTGTNLTLWNGAAGGAKENIAFGNRAYKGGAAPQTKHGFQIGAGCDNNLVTGNNLKEGGKTDIILDYGYPTTDKTAWLAAGNKLA